MTVHTPRQRLLITLAVAIHRRAEDAVTLKDADYDAEAARLMDAPPAVSVGNLRVEKVTLAPHERGQVVMMIEALHLGFPPANDAGLWRLATGFREWQERQ